MQASNSRVVRISVKWRTGDFVGPERPFQVFYFIVGSLKIYYFYFYFFWDIILAYLFFDFIIGIGERVWALQRHDWICMFKGLLCTMFGTHSIKPGQKLGGQLVPNKVWGESIVD